MVPVPFAAAWLADLGQQQQIADQAGHAVDLVARLAQGLGTFHGR